MNATDYTALSPGDFNDAMSDDAMKWADAFCQMNPGADHQTMFGWFANVIERSHDYRRWRLVKDDRALVDFISGVTRDRELMAEINSMPVGAGTVQ